MERKYDLKKKKDVREKIRREAGSLRGRRGDREEIKDEVKRQKK